MENIFLVEKSTKENLEEYAKDDLWKLCICCHTMHPINQFYDYVSRVCKKCKSEKREL